MPYMDLSVGCSFSNVKLIASRHMGKGTGGQPRPACVKGLESADGIAYALGQGGSGFP